MYAPFPRLCRSYYIRRRCIIVYTAFDVTKSINFSVPIVKREMFYCIHVWLYMYFTNIPCTSVTDLPQQPEQAVLPYRSPASLCSESDHNCGNPHKQFLYNIRSSSYGHGLPVLHQMPPDPVTLPASYRTFSSLSTGILHGRIHEDNDRTHAVCTHCFFLRSHSSHGLPSHGSHPAAPATAVHPAAYCRSQTDSAQIQRNLALSHPICAHLPGPISDWQGQFSG